ncbi:MAG TPA: GGDEF domain-containing protein [Phycisphaerae bacterium]|nr:GGDEF domain-containing protein [Phycisphaerae bacterium]
MSCLLVIGPRAIGHEVQTSLPDWDVLLADHALEGLWQAGKGDFDGILLALPPNERTTRTVRSIRQVNPARLLYACSAAVEPRARELLAIGVDDYLLTPLRRNDLCRALGVARSAPAELPPPVSPTPEELLRFSEILRDLSAGPRKTLARLAELHRTVFSAAGVRIQVDDLTVESGSLPTIVLEEPIMRGERVVGRISLAPRTTGSYGASAAAWLTKYAVLVDAAVQSARGQQHWQQLAWTDDLSELGNRRYFERRLAELIERAAAKHERLTLFLFDIDDFKTYNDSYGHDTGDELIREVAELLSRATRSGDVVARYGGDEFAVLFWDAEPPRVAGSHHPEDPTALAERFRRTLSEHAFRCLGPGAPGPVTISGGLACYPWDGKRPEQLLKAADDSLLAAKRAGKNRIQIAGGMQNGGPVA